MTTLHGYMAWIDDVRATHYSLLRLIETSFIDFFQIHISLKDRVVFSIKESIDTTHEASTQ